MQLTARTVFNQYAADLENEPGHWGMRLIEPRGGTVWRNRAQREFYGALDFHPSPTLPWAGVMKYFTPAELRRLNAAYAAAFADQRPVTRRLVFGAHSSVIRFFAVYGNLEHGVVVTHSEPSSYRAVGLPAQARA